MGSEGRVAGSVGKTTKAAKITHFTQLDSWQAAHKLRLSLYDVIKHFPPEERYALTDQVRRAAISVASNIAEGFSRYTINDKAHFYTIAAGSLTELQDQLILARDLQYVSELQFRDLIDQSIITHKLISGSLRSIRARSK